MHYGYLGISREKSLLYGEINLFISQETFLCYIPDTVLPINWSTKQCKKLWWFTRQCVKRGWNCLRTFTTWERWAYLPDFKSNGTDIFIFIKCIVSSVFWVINFWMNPFSFVSWIIYLFWFPFSLNKKWEKCDYEE